MGSPAVWCTLGAAEDQAVIVCVCVFVHFSCLKLVPLSCDFRYAAYVTGFPEDAHDEASWLLTFYATFHSLAYKGIANEALQSLAKIEGGFGEPQSHLLRAPQHGLERF